MYINNKANNNNISNVILLVELEGESTEVKYIRIKYEKEIQYRKITITIQISTRLDYYLINL